MEKMTSLDELFARDPKTLTDDELAQIVAEYQKLRQTYILSSDQKKMTKKKELSNEDKELAASLGL
jgi:ribonuclease HIII